MQLKETATLIATNLESSLSVSLIAVVLLCHFYLSFQLSFLIYNLRGWPRIGMPGELLYTACVPAGAKGSGDVALLRNLSHMCWQAIRDGVIEATIDHEKGYVQSKETSDIYSTGEPMAAFHQRISFCLDIHNQSVKVRPQCCMALSVSNVILDVNVGCVVGLELGMKCVWLRVSVLWSTGLSVCVCWLLTDVYHKPFYWYMFPKFWSPQWCLFIHPLALLAYSILCT